MANVTANVTATAAHEDYRHTAGLPADIEITDRYTAVGWLDILRDVFTPETWAGAVLAEAIRLNLVTVVTISQTEHIVRVKAVD